MAIFLSAVIIVHTPFIVFRKDTTVIKKQFVMNGVSLAFHLFTKDEIVHYFGPVVQQCQQKRSCQQGIFYFTITAPAPFLLVQILK